MNPVDSAPNLLEGLTAAQCQGVTSAASPLRILASAGAGKTRVLTRRIAYRALIGTADPRHVLALTFTRKAAGELGDRLRVLGLRDRVATGTFHAVAASQLRRWWSDRGQRPYALLDRKGRLLAPLAADRPALAGVPLADLAGQIEWAQARLISPDDFEAAVSGRALPVDAGELAGLYRRYNHEKRRRRLVDFDDLLGQCADALDQDLEFARAQRWQWRHLFVDEFQDVNPLQYRLLSAWMGASTDLCVVGDPDQAIYGWNGADPGILDHFGATWPGGDTIRLDQNHRCSPQIVQAAGAVLGAAGATLTSSRPDGPAPRLRSYPTGSAEAEGIAAEINRARVQGVAWSEMAVLVRTNAQVGSLRDACREAGIPVRVPGAHALLGHPAVLWALDQLGASDRPMAMVTADLDRLAADPTIESLGSTGDDARPALRSLVDLGRQYHRLDADGTGAGFSAWLPSALVRDPDGGAPGAAVTICSFHRAKGLEWTAVWLCGLERGLVPIGQAKTPEAEDEERRLLYVAATRAGRYLHCSWARERRFGTRAVPREESPWLHLLGATGDGLADTAAPVSVEEWRSQLRQQRDRLADGAGGAVLGPLASPLIAARSGRRNRTPSAGQPPMAGWPSADPDVMAGLRAWRAATARASGVPAHVLLHDVTLQALAALRPATTAELVEVPGLGPVKASRYGAALLDLVATRSVSA